MSQRCLPSCRPNADDGRLGSLFRVVPILGAVALAACSGGGIGDGGGNGGTTPQSGTLQLSGAAQSASEANGAISITVTRTGGSDGAVSVTLGTSDGTAATGQDFTAVTTSVSFAAGDSSAKSVDIPINKDALAEPAETFTVTLSAATGGATLGTSASATLTIQDDDTPGSTPSAGNSLNNTGVTTREELQSIVNFSEFNTAPPDWRLPNIKELISIVEAQVRGPCDQHHDFS